MLSRSRVCSHGSTTPLVFQMPLRWAVRVRVNASIEYQYSDQYRHAFLATNKRNNCGQHRNGDVRSASRRKRRNTRVRQEHAWLHYGYGKAQSTIADDLRRDYRGWIQQTAEKANQYFHLLRSFRGLRLQYTKAARRWRRHNKVQGPDHG